MKIKSINLCILTIAIILSNLIIVFSCKQKQNIKILNIGIAQYINHPGLDAAREGFLDEMKRLGFEEGKNIHFDYQNAQGDMSLTREISEKFVGGNYDLIYSLATPISQAIKKASIRKNIPIIFLTGIITREEESEGKGVIGRRIFLSKSSSMDEILKKINDVLGIGT